MNKFFLAILATAMFLGSSCTGQNNQQELLAPDAFEKKINQSPEALLLDVRTSDEFNKGHLANAINYDWNSRDFEKKVSRLDKNSTVLVYCLSGGRSAEAADWMRKEGWKQVYELDGGILKWKAAKLPVVTDEKKSPGGLSLEEFDQLTGSAKVVLVDFYADWCIPCKKMKPFLEEIAAGHPEIKLVRINADDNLALCEALRVESLPYLKLYKDKKLTWSANGYTEKKEILKQL